MSSANDSIEHDNNLHADNGSKPDEINKTIIRVGSRKSELALVQTNHVIALLQKLYPSLKFEIHKMTTMGDRVLNISLPKIGEKSLFTKDLEDALRKGVVDFVVHSLKDLPTALPEGMTIGAVLEREDPRDSLVLCKHHEGKCFKTLPDGSIIGTSSLRRIAQISRLYPHLKVHDIRGNLNTRLAKLDATDSKYAGIVLAQAGLVRLGWQKRVNHIIEPSEMLYAVGQGALAIECRSTDKRILSMLQQLVCHQTQCRIIAERSFLKTLGGGCSAPVAVHSILTNLKHISNDGDANKSNEYELRIVGSVWSLDGKIEIQAENSCHLNFNNDNEPTNKKREKDIEADGDGAVPSKKMKLSIDIETKNENENVMKSDQPSPPQVIDHSQLKFDPNNDLNQNLDIAAIMNVHNDAFKKCPYASLVPTNKSDEAKTQATTAANGDQSPKCPLNFAIGQDVMGQCPYFDATNSTDIMIKTTNSCGTCPFKNACNSNKSQTICQAADTSIDLTKCPFLNQSASSSKRSNDGPTNDLEDLLDKNTVPLFCGIYPHSCWPLTVFEKCEQLGQDLAKMLIEKDALSVMECAQNEIRQKV